MTTLTTLKLVAAKKPRELPAVQLRRNRLSTRIWEQIQLARSVNCSVHSRRWQQRGSHKKTPDIAARGFQGL